jgi:RimJ/RimL family protein N-acetyltransferase
MTTLRPVCAADAKLLWEWANDPAVRAQSFNKEPIPWEAHVTWLEKRLSSPDTLHLLMLDEEIPVGQIRYDREGAAAKISFTVDSRFRGRGFGLRLVSETIELARSRLGVGEIVAEVFASNTPSLRVFRRLGFSETGGAVVTFSLQS